MRRVLLGLAMIGALVLVGVALAEQAYTDPGGDAGAGTDITNATIRNDDAGLITFQLASANPIVANHAIALFIDADRNQATGGDGDEYWLFVGPLVGRAFYAWNGSSFVRTNPPSFYAGAASSNITEVRINKADIGNVSTLDVLAASISVDVSSSGDVSARFWDWAPDRGYWTYTLTTPAPAPTPTPTPTPAVVKPVIAKPVATQAVAGKPMAVTFAVTRSDNGQPLVAGTMTCDPSVSGRALAHRESFKGGKAKLAFTVPKAAAGKLLKVKVTITAPGGLASTRVATFRVR